MIYSHNQLICWNELTSYYTRQKDLALDGALSQRFVITFRLKKKTVSTHIFEIIFVENLSFFSFSHDYFEGNTDFTRIKHIRVLNDNDSITHSAYFH